MKAFTYKYSDTDHAKVVDAYCSDYNYQIEVDDNGTMVANPESRIDFTDRVIFEIIENQAFVYHNKKDDKTATDSRAKTDKVKRIK